METKENNTNTATVVIEQTTSKENTIHYALALMFFEYLGYVSPMIDWAEELCNGNDLPKYKKSILKADALSIFELVKDECPIDTLRSLYQDFYDVILSEYDENIKKLNSNDDLPF